MDDARGKYVSPSITETAFNCPHCGALAKQTWFKLAAEQHKKDEIPARYSEKNADFGALKNVNDDERKRLLDWLDRVKNGFPTIEHRGSGRYFYFDVFNNNISQCYNCNKISIWIGSNLAWPHASEAPLPNIDLSDDVRLDFEEAGRILREGLQPSRASPYKNFARS